MQYLPKPHEHWITAKHVLRYIKGMTEYQLCYRKKDDGLRLIAHSNANWTSGQNDRYNMSAYYFSLSEDGPPILWKSNKQPLVALSTCGG